MANLSLRHINKKYSKNQNYVVNDFNLEIQDKEFLVFVGPSGCGKSTTLRMIAGLEELTSGYIYIDNKLMNDEEPGNRDIAFVFQSYALFPHLSVYDNIAFNFKIHKTPKLEIKRKVEEVANILSLTPYLNRKPAFLSGGQKQRVAVGRAIVRDSKVLLMDEPLSNLDAKLRVQMRAELIKLHEQLNTTIVYVTHDQVEAMTMASRIVVMKDGFIQQIGSPKEVYNSPSNMFVASFIGTPGMNFIEGVVNSSKEFVFDNYKLTLDNAQYEMLLELGYVNKEIVLGIRPEHIFYNNQKNKLNTININIDVLELLGSNYNITFSLGLLPLVAVISTSVEIAPHSKIDLLFSIDKAIFFDKENQKRINYDTVIKEGIIFDLDGVLVSTDEFHYEAWKEVASSLDINFTKEDNNRLRGVSRMESLEIVLSLKPSLKLSISQKEEIAKKKNEIYKQLLDKLSPKSISEDTLYVLSELKNMGYKLAIGSSSKNAKYILERTNLLSYFDSVSDGNNITKTKPDPEVFLKASEMLGLKPSKCVVVEDAHAGIDAANKGGFLSIGLGDASSYKDANIKIKSLSQILDILRK